MFHFQTYSITFKSQAFWNNKIIMGHSLKFHQVRILNFSVGLHKTSVLQYQIFQGPQIYPVTFTVQNLKYRIAAQEPHTILLTMQQILKSFESVLKSYQQIPAVSSALFQKMQQICEIFFLYVWLLWHTQIYLTSSEGNVYMQHMLLLLFFSH